MSKVLFIVGPTGVGKTALAINLAEDMPLEVINGDALQVYRGLDIGTAKPDASVRKLVPHHLIDILDPDRAFSAGEFARRANDAIDDIRGRGKVPVVVGGSGFYLRALEQPLAEIPRPDEEQQRRWRDSVENESTSDLYRRLREVDADWAASIDPNDRQRVLRGLEVFHLTGKPLTAWHRDQPEDRSRFRSVWIGLTLPRKVLYDRIQLRTEKMLAQGWLAEVRRLYEQYGVNAPAFQAIGYRSLAAVVSGEVDESAAVAQVVQETRRYAKRQLTWFRRDPRIHWLAPDERAQAKGYWRGE